MTSHAASVALGALLAAAAFGAQGGSEVSRTATAEVWLLLAGGLAAAAGVAFGRGGRVQGASAIAAFTVLAVLSGASVAWSAAPELTWLEANKTLAYLLVFAGAVGAARVAPGGWSVVLKGILIGVAAVILYALASRVWPAALADNELYARIGKPYNYWNAVGVTVALALPPALWLGARRSGHRPANALAYPLLGLMLVALFLSYSRGSLAAAAIGVALWLLFVPLRLRSASVLAVSAAGAAPVIAWALSKDAFTDDGVSTAVRESVATEFGLLLAAMCLLLLAAGLAIGFGAARRPPSALLRRRAGIAVAAVACLVPLVALGSVALSDKGIGGTVSDLTSEKASIGGGPSRLTQASSSRGRYWRQAAEVFKDHPVRGTGAGSFRVSRLRHRNDALVAGHAHGYVAQTAADLGLLGLLASVALAAAWLATASRNLGVRRGGHRLPFDAERAGAVALALAALVFGLQSAIDWVWFVPGPTVMALVAAGFVAGRGPIPVLRDRERAPEAAATEAAPAAPAPGRPPRPSTERLVGAGAVVVVALACAWSAWQPERSDGAGDRALALLDEGKLDPAAREADRAHDMNPLSPKPRYVKAAILDRAGRPDEALAVLQQAVIEHPSEPDVWLRLADFQLHVLANPAAAVETLRGALYLDPHSRAAQAAFFEARERSRERTAAAPF